MEAILVIIVLGALLALALTQKPDPTTPEEIAQASAALDQAISEAEVTVGKFAPHSQECRHLLEKARYCRRYSGATERVVVTAWMIKQKRYEGVGYANKAAELALAARQLP